MAKKEKNTRLGRGLDSLIPKIEETEVEEGISLEDLLRESEEESKTFEELVEEVEEEFDGEDELQVLEKSADVEEEKPKDSSEYTNVFFNDDEKCYRCRVIHRLRWACGKLLENFIHVPFRLYGFLCTFASRKK